jgi:hypothetical protein
MIIFAGQSILVEAYKPSRICSSSRAIYWMLPTPVPDEVVLASVRKPSCNM